MRNHYVRRLTAEVLAREFADNADSTEMYRFDDTLFAKVIVDIVGFLDKSKPRTGRGFSRPEGTL